MGFVWFVRNVSDQLEILPVTTCRLLGSLWPGGRNMQEVINMHLCSLTRDLQSRDRWQTKYAVLILPSFFYSKNIEFVACISFPFFTDTFLQLSVERYSFSIAQLLKSCSRSFPNRSLSSPRSKRASFPCCSNWLFYLLLLKHRLPDPPLQRPAPLTKSSHSLQQLPLHAWGKP